MKRLKLLVVLISILSVFGCERINEVKLEDFKYGNRVTDELKNESVFQNDFLFKNIEIYDSAASTVITGEVMNRSGSEQTISIDIKMYDKNKKLKGVANTKIEKIINRDIKKFEIVLVGSYTLIDSFKIEVIK